MRFVISLLLPLSAFSFALGISLPLLRFERLYFLEERPSLMRMLQDLWLDGDLVLAGIVGLFSVALPGVKILLLNLAAFSGRKSRTLAVLGVVSKWSMLDVMLVALVVFAAKTSGLAAASVLPGLWFYGFAAISTAVAAHLCAR